MLRSNGIKVPRSRNRFSLSLLDRRKMSKPCSQLNSKVIRDKAECHIIAAIEKKCSVVAFKCVWRVHDDEIERAWSWICEKRDECDLTLSKMSEVCFFFSAISTSKLDSKKKTSKRSQPDEARESDDSIEESQINPSQISSQGKQIFPAISYWLACQTQNGSAVNPFKIQQALVKCGLEFYLSRASRKKIPTILTNYARFWKTTKILASWISWRRPVSIVSGGWLTLVYCTCSLVDK